MASSSSSMLLHQQMRLMNDPKDDVCNERAIAAIIEQDIEAKSDEKPEEPFTLTKILTKKIPELDAKLAASNLESSFSKLPSALLTHHIASCVDLKTQAVLTQTCKRIHPFFQPALTELRLKQLLQHIAYGQEDEAKKIIASNPNLLMMQGTATDYSGNTIEDVTPLTLTRGADDIGMLEMLLSYSDRLPDKGNEALKQMQEKFPESKGEEKPYDFNPLVAAITANNDVDAALSKFREDFKPRVIKQGKHCNPQALLSAMQAYDDNYEDIYNPWSGDQCSLFWRQVIGYLQRMLPACYAQAFCQGLKNVCNGREPLKRSLKLNDGKSFYPLHPTLPAGIGFEFGVFSYYGEDSLARLRPPMHWPHLENCISAYKAYIELKHQRFASLCNSPKPIEESVSTNVAFCRSRP